MNKFFIKILDIVLLTIEKKVFKDRRSHGVFNSNLAKQINKKIVIMLLTNLIMTGLTIVVHLSIAHREDILAYVSFSVSIAYSLFFAYVLLSIIIARGRDCLRRPCTLTECKTGVYLFHIEINKLWKISRAANIMLFIIGIPVALFLII